MSRYNAVVEREPTSAEANLQDRVSIFGSAAAAFAQLVREIPETAWNGPGLGEWDLRSLVGHASTAVSTVTAYP
jgi:hypothetical protein